MDCWGRCSGNHIPDGGDTGHGKTFNINGDCKQGFLDFLAQLQGYYINRDRKPAFQSVILAGIYDVRNIRRKIRPEEDHKFNSPWNIAADFPMNMSFFN